MIHWPNIDTVLLDMDGTLLDLSFDNFFWQDYLPQRYAEEHRLSLAQAQERVQTQSQQIWGSLDWYCVEYWSKALSLDVTAIKREVRHHIRLRPHAKEFLQWLHERQLNCMLVTNAHPSILRIKLEASGLNQLLTKTISSHEFNLAKENPGFWGALATRENLNLGHSLLIDDSLPVLDRAHAEGLGNIIQILQPDSRQAPHTAGNFPGIIHFTEVMTND